MSQLRAILQESLDRERETITILALLREKMDGVDSIGGRRRRRCLMERLGLKNMGCCGATWAFKSNSNSSRDSEDEEQQQQQQEQEEEQNGEQSTNSYQNRPENELGPACVGRIPLTSSGGMNLAAALAAERQMRVGPTYWNDNNENEGTAPGTPLRVSLMRLLAEEADGCNDGVVVEEEEEKAGASDSAACCCVCMGRKKDAAFIPCGHTFCRVCSRDMWLNRGCCPLCNRSILEVLDIF